MNRKTILVDVPKDFLINNIIDDGNIYKNGKLEIDECLVDEIKKLWWLGIHTQGCCCGHNQGNGFIQVERTDLQKMIDFDYEWYHDYPEELGGKNRYDAFIPKSKCHCKKEEIVIMNGFNKYPHYVYATVFIANNIPLDYRIGDRKRTWKDRSFKGYYFWESYVLNNFETLNLECKYKEILVNNDEEHNKAFEVLEEWAKSDEHGKTN